MPRIYNYALAEKARLIDKLHMLAPDTKKEDNINKIHGLKGKADEIRMILKYSTQASLIKRRFRRQALKTLGAITLVGSVFYGVGGFVEIDLGSNPTPIEKNIINSK